MKLVFSSHEDVVRAWFERITTGDGTPGHHLNVRSRNIYARGFEIYSYGPHFPLARYIPEHGVLLRNCDSYSVSTAKHQCHVRRHNPFIATFDVPTPLVTANPVKDHADFLQYFETQVRNALEHSKRARKYKEFHYEHAASLLRSREKFCCTFLPDNPDITALPVDVTAALVTMRLAA